MELYKFISETEIQQYNGGFVIFDGRVYTNPKAETIQQAGYKPLVNIDIPEYNIETQFISVTYQENENEITPIYTVNEIEFDTLGELEYE